MIYVFALHTDTEHLASFSCTDDGQSVLDLIPEKLDLVWSGDVLFARKIYEKWEYLNVSAQEKVAQRL